MKWQTEVPVKPGRPKIDYKTPVVVLGSCFAQHLGQRLAYFQYRNLSNPFGVVFHPAPLFRMIERAVESNYYTAEDLFEKNGLWFCMEVHTSLYASSSGKLLILLNERLDECRQMLSNCSHLILTLGTAWGYRHLRSGMLVANCHKMPLDHFHKELTRVSTIEASLRKLIKAVRSLNNDVAVLLTVSPVRHIRDGLQENNRSKAHLLAAVHQVVENNDSLHYFPSYEIMMDELRDYRYYADDLLHPSSQAVDHIWERFSESWLDPDQHSLRKEIDSIQKRLRHKPLHPESDEFLDFSLKLKHDITAIKKKLPSASFEE